MMLPNLSSQAKDLWSNSEEKVLAFYSVYLNDTEKQLQADCFLWLLRVINNAESFAVLEPAIIVCVGVLEANQSISLGRLLIR